jgi:thymidylate kinase
MKKNSKILHLIIDGSDKTGKTTVCNILAHRLKLRIVKMQNMKHHFDESPEVASQAFNEALYNFKDLSFIMDRGFPSSLVYSAYFGREYDFSYLEKWEEELNPLTIILTCDEPREPDDIVSQVAQSEIQKLYLEISKRKNWIVIDVTRLTPSETCDRIIKYINSWEK